MLKLLSGIMLLTVGIFSTSVYANPDNSCDGEQTIFDAYTINGGKHVGICYVAGGVRYVYGKESVKPEIVLEVPYETVDFEMLGNGDQLVTIPNGAYNYIIGEYLRGGPFLQVWKGDRLLTEIKLDSKVMENNIMDYAKR